MRPIADYPNYCITKDGRVWSVPRRVKNGRGDRLVRGRWSLESQDRDYVELEVE